MKLVMTLLVKDEADLIATQIRYHQAQGVDHFLVLDHDSQDQTAGLLQPFVSAGLVTLFRHTGRAFYQGAWMTELARRAYLHFQADWVINNDADEFWWSDAGSLKSVLASVPPAYRLVRVARHNFVSRRPFQHPFWQHLTYRQTQTRNFMGKPLSDKVCHRGEADIVVHAGSHSVLPLAASDIWPVQPLEIFHFPARTYAQFVSKVRNSGEGWAALPQQLPGMASGVRFLYAAYLAGRLPEIYAQWAYEDAALQAALQSQVLVKDRRFQEFMARLS
ncbi:MAG: glycosyltransferase family 2 protein [Candidatus Sericytochromatia bacterium]|nr:glycosyltransferase family 2 protein [Candidatus Sericytochromatia bacterium]